MAEKVVEIPCPDCKRLAWVKADKRDWLYLDCVQPATVDDDGLIDKGCGIFKYQAEGGQRRIRKRADEALAAINEVPIEPVENIEPAVVPKKEPESPKNEAKRFTFFSKEKQVANE